MAEVGIADVAQDFGSYHTMAGIGFFANIVRIQGFEIAGPTATRIEFGIGCKQRCAATDTAVYTCLGRIPVAPRKWTFGPFLACDEVFVGRQLSLPLGIGFSDFFHNKKYPAKIYYQRLMTRRLSASLTLPYIRRLCHVVS